MRKAYLLLMYRDGPESIDSGDSMATIPLQREAGRSFCRVNELAVCGELIRERPFDAGEIDSFVSTLKDSDCRELVVTNLELFNLTGTASQLLPPLGEAGIAVVAC